MARTAKKDDRHGEKSTGRGYGGLAGRKIQDNRGREEYRTEQAIASGSLAGDVGNWQE